MKHDFAYFNRIRNVGSIFLILAVCLGAAILNIFSSHHYCRKYLNGNGRYELSSNTLKIIGDLEQKVKISVLFERDNPEVVENDFKRLLSEYVECNPLISVDFVDPGHESEQLRSLSHEVGILPANVVVVQTNEKRKVLAIEEFYEIHNGEVIGFCGERTLTSAISALVKENKRNIYFTIGHGELDINDTSPTFGLSTLSTILRQKNFNVYTLDLAYIKDIPADADLVVIAGSKAEFLDFEMSLLKNYLDRLGGNLIVALDKSSDRELNKFLLDHGICVMQDKRVLPISARAEFNDDLLVKKFAPHEITNELINLKLPIVWGCTRETKAADWESEDFYVTELIQADGCCDQQEGEYIVATLYEKSALNEQPIEALNGKMLALGCADFLTNSRINVLGNKILFCRAVEFMCGLHSDESIQKIDVKKYRLSLNFKQYIAISAYCLLLCCLAVGLGIIVHIVRRK